MKVLFDVYHPSHVHLFKNAIWELEQGGHDVLVTSRDKEVTVSLLESYEIDHVSISSKQSGKIGLVSETVTRLTRMIRISKRFDPDVIAGRINPVSVYTSKLVGASNVMFKDSDYTTLVSNITNPFVDVIYIPDNFDIDLGEIEHRVNAFQELAYLHPNRFEPDPDLLMEHGITPEESYSVLRFVSMDAHHDDGKYGFSRNAKKELVSMLEEEGEVYITSEEPLDPEFEPYRLPVPPHLIHHLLSFANIYVGDSQTMATEAALLGTPAIRSNSFAGSDDLSNFIELEEDYKLLFSFEDENNAISKVNELQNTPDVEEQWRQRRDKLVKEKEDVTKDMIDVLMQEGENK